MKTKSLLKALFMFFMAVVVTGCHDSDPDPTPDPEPITSIAISEGIVGKWLLASSSAEEWSVYDFKKTQQMTAEWFADNTYHTGEGMFFTNDEKATLTATINAGGGKNVYLDWVATKVQAFQIDINVYGGQDANQLIGANSLYKIVGEQEIEYGAKSKVDYRKFTGTNDCSDFVSLDESIIIVNADGEIECKGAGSTYVVFNTPGGSAALKVNGQDKILSFSEYILGTWVTDVIGYTWERDVFGEDGYFYSQWSREVIFPTTNESAQGTYTIDETNKILNISVKTPYGQRIKCEYHITRNDKFSFDTDVYSGGDKTGVFYYQRLLSSLTLAPKAIEQPNYISLVGSSQITGFNIHDEKIATVDKTTGMITAVAKGMTYVDVITNNGVAVVEIVVE